MSCDYKIISKLAYTSQIPMPSTQNANLSSDNGSIPVQYAGIVLLNNYLPALFERLKLIDENRKFISTQSQHQAVASLYYLVSGVAIDRPPSSALLNLVCGLPLSTAIDQTTEISEDCQTLINGLIQAVIEHWPAMGNTSVQGFRESWLIRDGLLRAQEDRWELRVERRIYDILISKSPFAFSVIKYPWTSKPLHVHWPY
ncbi:hypothetical protein DBR11_27600 [Pedobacter sp. HMWF019]|uniref:contractile injection system tape measure protein n=1 Tax=Pedobacter sp. HMWF019 TaxID=2056856 RepID=UPI000D38C089|nr:contractile injection system tape measure protein [Pedobacter sp. HMWF019]PTS92068.1 hypothetical protein DBR11_27600 [Pedobacter sp. HMWF019]